MNLLIIGNDDSLAEFSSKFGPKHSIAFKSCTDLTEQDLVSSEVIFDFEISPDHYHGQIYNSSPHTVLMLNSVKTTVADLVAQFDWKNPAIGFNGFPGMFDRSLLELALHQTEENVVEQLCKQLQTDYRIVIDQVGMVTPRVVCMIINEACYTMQEGTAIKEDIDLAMKLGTNYPAGPFEMLESIGVKNIYELLQALYRATGEERYQACPWLKKRYHQQA